MLTYIAAHSGHVDVVPGPVVKSGSIPGFNIHLLGLEGILIVDESEIAILERNHGDNTYNAILCSGAVWHLTSCRLSVYIETFTDSPLSIAILFNYRYISRCNSERTFHRL